MPRRLWYRQLHVADEDGQSREFGMEAELGEQARLRRAAIQWLSGSIPRERIFTHLGWRRRGGGGPICTWPLSRLSPSKTVFKIAHFSYTHEFNARFVGMKDLPHLVRGNCPDCPSTEIIVKEIDQDGTSYEGYCLHCGVDVFGALISGTDRAAVLK
ncbi:MAG: hypothetical protein ABSE57_25080 [Bryobacteraceae bacterium]|jgi:hypothetical protein